MTIIEIVNKLIGPIQPVGSTKIDNNRYSNLEDYVDLYREMSAELRSIVRRHENSYEYSRKRAADLAKEALDERH